MRAKNGSTNYTNNTKFIASLPEMDWQQANAWLPVKAWSQATPPEKLRETETVMP